MTELVVDTAAIRHNFAAVGSAVGKRLVIGVVKANGYGMGLVEFARVLTDAGCTTLAVTDPADALTLRESGLTEPEVLVLRSTAVDADLDTIIAANATATIGSPAAAEALARHADRRHIQMSAHLEVDTGMGRYGFMPDEVDAMASAAALPRITVTGLYTHYASALSSRPATLRQVAAFQEVIEALRSRGVDSGLVHASNSAALLLYPDLTHFDAVRCGSALTGRLAGHQEALDRWGLRRVGVLRAPIIEVRRLPAHHPVGYGAGYVTRRAQRVAVIPVGYADGFTVTAPETLSRALDCVRDMYHDLRRWRTHLTVDWEGKGLVVLGRVGLNHIVVDIADYDCQVGQMVTIPVAPLHVPPHVPRVYR